jgi:hypothetical protein
MAENGSSDSRTIAILTHLLGLFFWIVPSLVAYFAVSDDAVKAHAREALNFMLSHTLWGSLLSLVLGFLTAITMGVGGLLAFPIAMGFGIYMLVVIIKATMKASKDDFYYYPLTVRLIS